MVVIHTENWLNNYGEIFWGIYTTAYNKPFEYALIKEIAETVPDLAPHLMDICEHIKDFLYSFRDWYRISPSMVGQYSIKGILPVS